MMTSSRAPILLRDIDGTLLYNDVRGRIGFWRLSGKSLNVVYLRKY